MTHPGAASAPTASGTDPDALLLRIAADRDRGAFAQLFVAVAPRIKGYLMRQGTDAGLAEEITQEVMLTVWNRAASFEPKLARAVTWIFTIARNKRIDRLRRERRPAFDPEDPAFQPDPVPSAESDFLALQDGARLRAAMVTLPPEQAALLERAYYLDQSHRAIADATGLPLGTVKSRIRLALARLRAALEEG